MVEIGVHEAKTTLSELLRRVSAGGRLRTMRLLDTQTWLWMQTSPERLRAEARTALVNEDNELFLSAANSWEIAIKYALGKLPLPEPPADYVPSRMRSSRGTFRCRYRMCTPCSSEPASPPQ